METPEIVQSVQSRPTENEAENESKNGSGKMKPSKKYKKSVDFVFVRNQRIFGRSVIIGLGKIQSYQWFCRQSVRGSFLKE